MVRPKKFGYFNFTAAEVTYNAESSGTILTGLSSDPGQGVIIAARDYDRQFSAHLVSNCFEFLSTRLQRLFLVGLGSFCCDDSPIPGHPLPAVVVKQVQVRDHRTQEGLILQNVFSFARNKDSLFCFKP